MVAAAQEERFSRVKNDSGFPRSAVDYCLRQAGISVGELAYVAYAHQLAAVDAPGVGQVGLLAAVGHLEDVISVSDRNATFSPVQQKIVGRGNVKAPRQPAFWVQLTNLQSCAKFIDTVI